MIFLLGIAAFLFGKADAQASCPPSGFRVAGASALLPLSLSWAEEYVKTCPAFSIVTTGDSGYQDGQKVFYISGGRATVGVRRVCNIAGGQVEIGNVSREWTAAEATSTDGWNLKCKNPNSANPNNLIKADVAIDGLTFAVKKTGTAASCLAILRGLTLDQLRWIFSDQTQAQLIQTGWNKDALKLGKGTGAPLWSNLHRNCQDKEINLSGPSPGAGGADFFKSIVFKAPGEDFDKSGVKGFFASTSDPPLVAYVKNDDAAITYFGYSWFFENQDSLLAIAVKNSFGDYVKPSSASFSDGTYNPFTRRLHMNLLSTALARTRPYLEFGYSPLGDSLVKQGGLDPLPAADQILMLSRVKSTRGINLDNINCSGGKGGKTKIAFANLAPKNENGLRTRLYAIHFSAKCPGFDIELSNGQTNANALTRACGGSPAVGSAVTFAKTTYSTVGNAYTYKCPPATNKNKLIEVLLAPSVFGYLNDAPALLPVSRPFFRFILSTEGAKLGSLLSLPVNSKTVNDNMLQRLPISNGCFSGDSTVEVRNQGVVTMKNLQIGDEVKVSGGQFSKVFSFGHKNPDAKLSYISIEAGKLTPLLLTSNHLILVEGKFVPASSINVGDKVTLVDGTETVTRIRRVVGSGAFAPHTMEGTIVVDGLVASSYVILGRDSSSFLKVGGVSMDWHTLLHISQAPRRVVCLLSEAVCASETYNSDGVSTWVEGQKYFARWLLDQNPFVIASLFLPVYLFFAFASLIEAVISYAGIFVAGVIVAATVFMTQKKAKFSA